MSERVFTPAFELAAEIRDGSLSSVELLESFLARIDRSNSEINAVVTMDVDGAEERCGAADQAAARGEIWGPLHGLPMTVKDAFEVAGMTTTSGAPELADHRSEHNAVAVQRLVDAGAVVFGKTNLPLFAADLQTYNDVFGTTNNPWDVTRCVGGSSGGPAAAVAAGFTPLELGSDLGGSIRNPASHCGVYGHRPTWGLVPLRGHIPGPPGTAAPVDLAVAGPIAHNAADLERALELLAGPDSRDATAWSVRLPEARHRSLADFRIGVLTDHPSCPVDPAIAGIVADTADALAAAGAHVTADLPDVDLAADHARYLHLLYSVTGAGLPARIKHGLDAAVDGLAADDHSLAAQLARGTSGRHRHWLAANERRHRNRQRWDDYFRHVDALLCPATPTAAFPHDHSTPSLERTLDVAGTPVDYWAQLAWAGLATAAYLPATVAPGGTTGGLPVGIQIIGPHLEDRTPIRLAALMADVIGGFAPPPGFD